MNTHSYTHIQSQLSVDVFVLGLGLGSVLEKRRKMREGGKTQREKGRRGREGEPDFTFCACCRWQTADLQRRHARLGNNGEMRAVPKDYMKWAMCFKVVQLDYPLQFLTCVQSRDRYKAGYKQTSQIHMLLSKHSEGEGEREWREKTDGGELKDREREERED